jgi:heme A synthase
MAAERPRRLAALTVAGLLALMVLGNVVSATGSGLACPDWPLCHGRLIPPLAPDVLLEYGHRVTALATTVLLVATTVLAMRRAPGPRARRLGRLLLALLGVQILLGGITVLLRLPHLVSTAHLVNALLILAGLLVLVAEPAPRQAAAPRLAHLLRAGLPLLLLQLALGGYVRHTGAGWACPDFPLCAGDLVPGHWLGVVHWVHRWLGVALVPFFVHVGLACRRSPWAGTGAALALLGVAQPLLGVATVLLGLSPVTRAAHAALGYALWALAVWLAVRVGLWQGRAAPGPGGRLAEATHAS